jgi:ubiquinone/menaquinone biosynthesis C-methylase UbiE
MRMLSRPTSGTTPAVRNKHAVVGKPTRIKQIRSTQACTTARAYDQVGEAYGAYADGHAADAGFSTSRFAHADNIVWDALRETIDELRGTGVATLRILDAGCGPGTWTARVAAYARRVRLSIDAIGFDIAEGQLEIARRRMHRAATASANSRARFVTHNLADPLPWRDHEFHIVLCNYIVLNHLDRSALPGAIGELCRVANHRVIATLRAVASPVSACIIGTEHVSQYHHDRHSGELRLVLKDGSEHILTLNLYSAESLKALFGTRARIVDLRAVDLFLNRFQLDENWTAQLARALPGRAHVLRALREAEEQLCREPAWLDHGTHILLVAQPGAHVGRSSGRHDLIKLARSCGSPEVV